VIAVDAAFDGDVNDPDAAADTTAAGTSDNDLV
jgi:hypothetical protein